MIWNKPKEWLKKENSQPVTNCNRLKLTVEDGKMRFTELGDAQILLRLIQSVPIDHLSLMHTMLIKLNSHKQSETKIKRRGCPFANSAIRESFISNDTDAVWAANSSEWFDYHDYIQYVQSPSLIYVGSEEPSVNDLIELSKQLPNCTLRILENIDHAHLYWDSKLVAPLIRDFILNF